MVSSFFKYLEFEKRYSNHTLISYRNDLDQFQSFLSNAAYPIDLENAEHKHIRGWLIHLVQKELSARTVNRKIASIRSYYKYAMRNGYVAQDPSSKIKMLKAGKSLPVFAKEKELTKTLDQMIYQNGFKGLRDQMVMEFLYATGIRLSELINLRESDIDHQQGQVKVLGETK